jgi:hypothetical protein
MKSVDANVFFSSTLLRFDQPGGPVNANDETSCYFGVKSSGMSGFLDAENPLDPGNNLVRTGVCGFVEVEDPALDVLREGALERGGAERERGVVVGAYVQLVKVLEEERPVSRVQRFGVDVGGFDLEADLGLDLADGLLLFLLLFLLSSRRDRIGQNFRHFSILF